MEQLGQQGVLVPRCCQAAAAWSSEQLRNSSPSNQLVHQGSSLPFPWEFFPGKFQSQALVLNYGQQLPIPGDLPHLEVSAVPPPLPLHTPGI